MRCEDASFFEIYLFLGGFSADFLGYDEVGGCFSEESDIHQNAGFGTTSCLSILVKSHWKIFKVVFFFPFLGAEKSKML